MTDMGYRDIIDRINAMAVQGPWCNSIAEFEAWLNGYKTAKDDILQLIHNMMDDNR